MPTPRFSYSTIFEPKDGGERRIVRLSENVSSGYDLALMIDSADYETEDSGFFLELGVEPDGLVCGQITAHPGHDALASFTCTQNTLRVEDDGGTTFAFGHAPVGHESAPDERDQRIAALEKALRHAIMCTEEARNRLSGDPLQGADWLQQARAVLEG